MPSKPGVYCFLDQNSSILYVGKAKDLKARVSSYFTNSSQLGEKTRLLVSQIEKIKITIVDSELESLLLESFYIKKFSPKYNIRMTDDKSYPLIRITLKDRYPAVLFARRIDDPQSVYFGPFPNSRAVKLVLKTIRRVFPFVAVMNHPKKVCLYHHLGLCPCPPVFASESLRLSYRKNIKRIIAMLEGKSKTIMQELEKERDKASHDEDFERATDLQQRIQALGYITQPFHRPFEYDLNPNLRTDVRARELNALKEALETNGLLVEKLDKIECYDISNIQGTNATGSMVVFVSGEKEGSLYRKYKIQREATPNDFASMEEVLTRRLKHTEWKYPDLLIVDGGKGQITSALQAFHKAGVSIPLIGLAKREETIIIPKSSEIPTTDTAHFTEVSLPKNSPGLQLLMRVRNEAHRFAITYHRKLRSKAFTDDTVGITR